MSHILLQEASTYNLSDYPLFIQNSKSVVFRGAKYPQGDDYLCGNCKGNILMEGIQKGEVFDILIECIKCGGKNITNTLEFGKPLPLKNKTLCFQKGNSFLINTPVINQYWTVLAGEPAVRQWEKILDFNKTKVTFELEPENLNNILKKIQSWFFNDQPEFQKLYKINKKRLLSKKIDRRKINYLFQLYLNIETIIKTLQTHKPVVDVVSLSEAMTVVSLIEKWKVHPYVENEVLKKLNDPLHFEHNILQLIAADYLLFKMGYAIGFEKPLLNGNSDLFITLGAFENPSVEIKAPLQFRNPKIEMDNKEIKNICTNTFNRSANQRRGGILIVGGFSLPVNTLDVIETAFSALLSGKKTKNTIAVMILNHSLELNTLTNSNQSLQPVYGVRVIKNPHYVGAVNFSIVG